jgi:hypothetical protein
MYTECAVRQIPAVTHSVPGFPNLVCSRAAYGCSTLGKIDGNFIVFTLASEGEKVKCLHTFDILYHKRCLLECVSLFVSCMKWFKIMMILLFSGK